MRDLAVANAFFKPGPCTGGMARTFVRRYRGEEPVSYLHPAMEPILGQTQGVLIFQEQILRVATQIAGLSWEQADHLRRGMSKFKPDEMATMREQFLDGCQPAFTAVQAAELWDQVVAFAGYGFNQGHATAYADVSYRSAYLKVHWPAEFLCARLANYGGFHHPVIYAAEAKRLGIQVRPPHVNHSGQRFTLAWEESADGEQRPILWMGLGRIRDLRRNAIRSIVGERGKRPFSDLRDLIVRVPLQNKEIDHLIRCGALDGLGASRRSLLVQAREIERAGSARQLALPFQLPEIVPESPAERLAWERKILNRPVSIHPLELVADRLPEHIALARVPQTAGRRVVTAGVRLPGWTGGSGFFLADAHTFMVARQREGKSNPPSWEPLVVRGRWQTDEWGTSWLQADEITRMDG